jgi:microcystin-dependent protein
MAEPFLGEIRLMSFDFPPKGWALCDGQLLPIAQNQALYALMGTTYGGNGQTTFALPDLRGRVPIHRGNGHALGERLGEQAHTLTVAELPQHTHAVHASREPASTDVPTDALPGGAANLYGRPASLAPLSPSTVGTTGGSEAHMNMQPFLALSFCIALQGIVPTLG